MDEASYSPLLQFMGCFNTQAPPVKVSRDASGKIYKKNVMICNKPISNLTLFGDQEQGLGIVCKDCPDIEGELAVSAQAIFWTHLPAVQKVQLNVCYRGRLPLFTRQFSLFYADKITCSRDSEPLKSVFSSRFLNAIQMRDLSSMKFLRVEERSRRAQVDLIATKLRELSGALRKIKVFTVDEFQGRESDVVLVSLARSDGLGFLRDRFITATGRQSNLRINVEQLEQEKFVCLLDTRTSSSLITYQCQRMKVTQNASFTCFDVSPQAFE
uniref:DNA2/NAM7 helicase-like C-terminal domain-containing protein n=1 Tax=Ditylenchus dipsaci TaxID=166011 RepID=A0A915CTE5_9BILA